MLGLIFGFTVLQVCVFRFSLNGQLTHFYFRIRLNRSVVSNTVYILAERDILVLLLSVPDCFQFK